MNEFQTFEFTTTQKTYGIWLVKKIALIISYIAFVITVLIVGFLSRIGLPLLAFTPLATWILIFITWRYVSVEYECSMTSGQFTFAKVYGSKTRKVIFETEIKAMSLIAPYTDEYLKKAEAFRPTEEYCALSSPKADNQYFAIFENKDAKRVIFIFEANKRCLDIMKFYNSTATVIERSNKTYDSHRFQ